MVVRSVYVHNNNEVVYHCFYLFNLCIENSEPSSDLQVRLDTLLKNTTSSIYTM